MPSGKSYQSINNLLAPCGMNCELCSGYQAGKHRVKEQGIKMPYCPGCRPRDKQCAFLKKNCNLLANKTVEFCYECREFPCRRLSKLDSRYQENYHMSMIENLNLIKQKGRQAFLKQEKRKWQCTKCKGVICCHNGLCFNCDLKKLSKKKQLYRWDA